MIEFEFLLYILLSTILSNISNLC